MTDDGLLVVVVMMLACEFRKELQAEDLQEVKKQTDDSMQPRRSKADRMMMSYYGVELMEATGRRSLKRSPSRWKDFKVARCKVAGLKSESDVRGEAEGRENEGR